MIRRSSSPAALALLASTVTLAAGCAAESHPPKTNVLLITIDTLRNDHTSLAGYERDTTPRLRRLAGEGATFRQAYAPTATTGPTHATLFTSLYPIAHGVVKNGLTLHAEALTLAEVLGTAGYRTGAVASSFVLDAKFGYGQGFGFYDDDFDARTATMPMPRWQDHEIEGRFDQPAAAATDKAVRWLDGQRGREEPFFLFVHYFDPHAPYTAPEEFADRFVTDGADELQATIDEYDREIAYADREVGRLLDHLRDAGWQDDTLVVVTADHGEGLMQHGHPNHGVQIYEEAVRVPLVFRLPGRIAGGSAFDPPVELVDVAPTVLELLGLSVPEGVQGRSLLDALVDGAALDEERPVYLHRRHYEPGPVGSLWVAGEKYGIRVGSWKYIFGEAERTEELFDLAQDPGETANLREAHEATALELRGRLDRWLLTHSRSTPSQPDRTEADLEALRSLGYVN